MNDYTFISWLGFVLTCIAVIQLGRGKRRGWEVGIVSNLIWILYGFLTRQWAIVATNIVLVALNTWGWMKWRKWMP